MHRAWKRHVTLAIAALAFLAVLAAIEKAEYPAPVLPSDPDQAPPADCGTIALTVAEAQRLFHLYSTLTRETPPNATHTRRPRSPASRRHQPRSLAPGPQCIPADCRFAHHLGRVPRKRQVSSLIRGLSASGEKYRRER